MIKTWAMAVCLGAAAIVTSVGALAQQSFTPQQGAAYMAECTSAGSDQTLCQCVWNGVQTRMSAAEYAELDAAFRVQQIHPSMGKYELIVGECNGTSRVTASNPEAYPGHTSANFMSACVNSGVSQAICACTMNTLERQMPLQSFAELDHMMNWGKGEQHPQYPAFVQIVQTCAAQNPS